MPVERDRLIEEARTWIDTPYVHQGRLRGIGCDCIGLLIGVATPLGLTAFEAKAYGRLPNGNRMRRLADENLTRIPRADIQPGDVLLMAWRRAPQHLALVTQLQGRLGMLHADGRVGRVVEHTLSDDWRERIVGTYAIPGVI